MRSPKPYFPSQKAILSTLSRLNCFVPRAGKFIFDLVIEFTQRVLNLNQHFGDCRKMSRLLASLFDWIQNTHRGQPRRACGSLSNRRNGLYGLLLNFQPSLLCDQLSTAQTLCQRPRSCDHINRDTERDCYYNMRQRKDIGKKQSLSPFF